MRFYTLLTLLLTMNSVIAETTKIAFGSCLKQWNPQPIWHSIVDSKPDAFIFAGDNVYTDAGLYLLKSEPKRIGDAYQSLAEDEGFQKLRQQVPIFATWDDHDYGQNDAGADYPYKKEAKQYFLSFFSIPANAPERKREGIYSVKYVEKNHKIIQVILLDTRTFRSPLIKAEPQGHCKRKQWGQNTRPDATILGKTQWQWLEQQLKKPADHRVIVSSIQVIPEQHCWEKWSNFPNERKKLFQLIKTAKANNVILVSGDRHLGEISKLPAEVVGYPIYEVTASGLNSAMTGDKGKAEPNQYRVIEENVRQDHFGMINFADNKVSLQIHDVEGQVIRKLTITQQ